MLIPNSNSNLTPFLPSSTRIAIELGAEVNSSYAFSPDKVTQDLKKLSEIDSTKQNEAQIEANVEVLQDLVFNFLPELIGKFTDQITMISELAIVARHKMKDSIDVHYVLDKFSELKKPALVQGMSAVEILNGKKDRLHKLESSPNGIDVQDQRARDGQYPLFFGQFPRASTYMPDRAKKAFQHLENVFKGSGQNFNRLIDQLLKDASPHFRKDSPSAQFFTGAFFDVYKESLKGLENLNNFVIELRKNLPQNMQERLTRKIRDRAKVPLTITGSAVYRLVTNPTQVYDESTAKVKPKACPFHSSNRTTNPPEGFTKQQRP